MDEREMFEAAYRAEFPVTCQTLPDRFKREDDGSDEYENGAVHVAWVMWQAARRTTPDREAIIEECAMACEDVAQRRNVVEMAIGATMCAGVIRALKTAPTISSRDTLIEEIAEMVDHMGEGRRLEEYVGAIRSFKTAPNRALDRLAENERELGLDYMDAPASDKGGA